MTGFLWIAGFLAITGAPPFAPFISEFNILGVSIGSKRYVLGGIFLFLLTAVFIAMSALVLRMVQGKAGLKAQPEKLSRWLLAPQFILLVMILILGLYIPDWLHRLLSSGAMLLRGN